MSDKNVFPFYSSYETILQRQERGRGTVNKGIRCFIKIKIVLGETGSLGLYSMTNEGKLQRTEKSQVMKNLENWNLSPGCSNSRKLNITTTPQKSSRSLRSGFKQESDVRYDSEQQQQQQQQASEGRWMEQNDWWLICERLSASDVGVMHWAGLRSKPGVPASASQSPHLLQTGSK